MYFIADFHIHSRYSRATSPQMDFEHLDKAAQKKGITVVGTGDFTHPLWFKAIQEKLEPAESGLLKLQQGTSPTRFILSSEISCIYSKANRVRKIHILILAPDIKTVEKINVHLGWIGNLKSDGRPILGLDAKELTKIVFNVNPDCLVIPCHMWTPWFSLFGSKSGFDRLEDCFEEYSQYIFAGETGLSSDPAMNWRLSALDRLAIISCSDAHSAEKLGREACVFDTDISYPAIAEALKQKDPAKFLYTIEFFPEEGKYHFDGHRLCNVSLSPQETKKYNGLCPVCGRFLTIGVLNRVEELADRPEGFQPANAIPYKNLIPLEEIIAESLKVGVGTKLSLKEYDILVEKFGSEFNVLLKASKEELSSATLPEIAQGISLMREGKVSIKPGYDGVYGKVSLFSEGGEKNNIFGQGSLF